MTLAIVIHVFYPEMWEELADCVRNFGAVMCDIFITLPADADESLEARIRGDFPTARIHRIENRGYDVGPFFYVLHEINLAKYDYVVKLHTKRNRIGFVNYQPLVGNGAMAPVSKDGTNGSLFAATNRRANPAINNRAPADVYFCRIHPLTPKSQTKIFK